MATEKPRSFDAHDVMASERTAKADDVDLPPIDPRELQAKYLLGIAFPASRDDVVVAARANDAPERIVQFLEGLEEREFADAGDLAAAIENAASSGRATTAGGQTERASNVEPSTTAEDRPASPVPPPTRGELGGRTAGERERPRVGVGLAVGLLALALLVVARRRRP